MSLANRATLKGIRRKTVDVTVELEVEGSAAPSASVFRLREMSGTERDDFEISTFREEKYTDEKGKPQTRRVMEPKLLRARLVAFCLIGDDGARLYGDNEVEALSSDFPAMLLAELFEAAQKLNGLDAKAVDDAEKNSPSGPPAASISA